jgi:hypothetical protein
VKVFKVAMVIIFGAQISKAASVNGTLDWQAIAQLKTWAASINQTMGLARSMGCDGLNMLVGVWNGPIRFADKAEFECAKPETLIEYEKAYKRICTGIAGHLTYQIWSNNLWGRFIAVLPTEVVQGGWSGIVHFIEELISGGQADMYTGNTPFAVCSSFVGYLERNNA